MGRDMSEAQFVREIEKRGMRRSFGGYVQVTRTTSIYRFNAGGRRRDQLAYLIAKQSEGVKRGEKVRSALEGE